MRLISTLTAIGLSLVQVSCKEQKLQERQEEKNDLDQKGATSCHPNDLARHKVLEQNFSAARESLEAWSMSSASSDLNLNLDKLQYIENKFFHMYGGHHNILNLQNKILYTRSYTDQSDQCFYGNRYFEKTLSDEELVSIKSSLRGLRALDNNLPTCNFNEDDSKFPNELSLYFADTLFIGLRINGERTCNSEANPTYPLVDSEVKAVISKAEGELADIGSGYPQ